MRIFARQSGASWFLAAVVFASILGCSRARSMAASDPSFGAPAARAGAAAPAPGQGVPSADRAMRITVETTVSVRGRDAAVAALRELVRASGGYVSEGKLSGSDAGGSATFTVKVPAAALGPFRAKVAALGEVVRDTERAEDVTEARADLRARLHNARAAEARLLDLLATRAGNLADVVLVDKELAATRETIERFEAEERTMEGQIAFATCTIELTTVYVPPTETTGHRLASAARDGLTTAQGFVLGTALFALEAGPTLLVLLGMLVGGFLLVRAWVRLRRTRASPPGAAA